MQDHDGPIQQFREENRRLKDCLDVALNTVALCKEEIQQLKDEIALLKGQKPRPKIPPSTLEGPKDPGKKKDKTPSVSLFRLHKNTVVISWILT